MDSEADPLPTIDVMEIVKEECAVVCSTSKPKYRIQKFVNAWTNKFPWIARDFTNPMRAWCQICKKGMNASFSIIQRHSISYKHKKNTKRSHSVPNESNIDLIGDNHTAVITLPSGQSTPKSQDISVTYSTDPLSNTKGNLNAIQVCYMVDHPIMNIFDILDKYVPHHEATEVKKLIYGKPQETLELPERPIIAAEGNNFELKAFKFPAAIEELSSPRIVRVGLIQNEIVLPTSKPLADQREALYSRLEGIVHTAHLSGVNIVCLQEAWPMPFAFCNKEKLPWCEFAEDPYTGPTIQLCQKWAKKYEMVIISPIIERDQLHGNSLWNTAVVISDSGDVIGSSRKNHISRNGIFNEYIFYSEANKGYPVFQTKYGKLAVNIGDGRHHPHSWMMYGLNGAEVVFNPSAAAGEISEEMWATESRAAAYANSFYTCSVNRVGKESFPSQPEDLYAYFGSSFVTAPNGSQTPELSKSRDGLLVAELDLNLCQQVKDHFGLRNSQRLEMYIEELKKMTAPNYQPNLIKDKSL